ncbi:MAG: YDG domain-containing protein, partial [Angelakisella sp.]
NLWYGWTLPAKLDDIGVSKSAGTLAVTTGNSTSDFGQDNAITLTATFDKVAKVGKQRTLAINQVEFKDGVNTLGAIATATKNADGKWVATLNVNTKGWAVGAHKLTATFAGNHELGGSTTNEVTVTINKAEQAALNIGGVPNKVTYGDSNFPLSTTGGSGNGAVTYAVTAGTDVVSVTSAGEVTVLKAGAATITATKVGDTNYNVKTATAQITVAPATPTLTWGSATQSVTYTGSAAVITAPTATGVTGGTTPNGTISYTYEKKSSFSLFTTPESGLPVNAGTYTVTAHIVAAGNYTAADSTTMELTINKSTPTLTIGAGYTGKTYDGTAVTNPTVGNMTITGAAYANVKFAYSKNSNMSSPLAEAPKDAGTYYVQANVVAGDNTNAASSNIVSFTITQAALTVTGGTVTPRQYNGGTGAAVTSLTFSGLVNGETLAITTDYTVGSPAYNTADAGTNKTVTGTATLVSNAKTNNYTLTG